MAPRAIPTVRRSRLGAELRKLRERAKMTSIEAATALAVRPGQISNIETARFGVSVDRVRAMANAYGCEDEAFVDALTDMAQDRSRGWWDTFQEVLPRSLLDVAELEHYATALRSANTAHVPGLLQTTDHTREVMRQAVPALSRTEVEHRVNLRLQRQGVLDREDPVTYQAVVHEAALRVPVGGRDVSKRQLGHLLDQSEREHITLQVIPFSAGAYPGSGQTLVYVHDVVPQLDTVYLDQSHGPLMVDAAAELDGYRALLARMESVALSPSESRTFIHTMTTEL
ncbi:helix-turn-helix transcriptional regulator [Streptomyces sp. NPDC048442]|uniref:helix-turn-helix domain-containing protein n=1 Tax=Streptomyces sp. NPDC048442 TaxID=3154823 RepID=UPI00341DFE18